jgi:peptide deformylase
MEEGCLSLPEVWIQVTRPTEIILKYMTESGKPRELKLSGWDARVVQHEVDHLDGVLIVDHRRSAVL